LYRSPEPHAAILCVTRKSGIGIAANRDSISGVLEIGSWEERSTIFFLNYLPPRSIRPNDAACGRARESWRPYAGASVIEGCTSADRGTIGSECRTHPPRADLKRDPKVSDNLSLGVTIARPYPA
jgi:hypothetical protein